MIASPASILSHGGRRIESKTEEASESRLATSKKRRKPGCAFFAFGFSKSKPLLSPAKARCFAGSGVHRHESGRGRPNRRCHRDLCLSQLNVRPDRKSVV